MGEFKCIKREKDKIAILAELEVMNRFSASHECWPTLCRLIDCAQSIQMSPDGKITFSFPENKIFSDQERILIAALSMSRSAFFSFVRDIRRKSIYRLPCQRDVIYSFILKAAHFARLIKMPTNRVFANEVIEWLPKLHETEEKIIHTAFQTIGPFTYVVTDDISYLRWRRLDNGDWEVKVRSWYPCHYSVYGGLAIFMMRLMGIDITPMWKAPFSDVLRKQIKYRCIPTCRSWDKYHRLVARMIISPDPSHRWIHPPIKATRTINYFTLEHLLSDYFYGTDYIDVILLRHELCS